MSGHAIAFPKSPAALQSSISGRLVSMSRHEHLSACSADFIVAVRELGMPIMAKDATPPHRYRCLVWADGQWEIGMHHDAYAEDAACWTDEDWTILDSVIAWLPLPPDLA